MARRPRTLTSACIAVLAVASVPAAQERPKPATPKRAQTAWFTLTEYDAKTSRLAFAACDSDGDDRLDVREARRALPNMGAADNPEGFRGLDANRNGFVHWDEFDGRFRRLVRQGDKFLVRPARVFATPKKPKPPTPVDPTEQAVTVIMSMVAEDDDPDVSKTEFTKLLVELKQPASLAATFAGLDADRSGGLSAAELLPVIAKVPYLLELAKIAPDVVARPTVSPTALHERLDRMHPSLGRWSEQIFRTADRDQDGKLSAEEIDPSAK